MRAFAICQHTRECLKIDSWQMCATICGNFGSDEGGVVGYAGGTGAKYAIKWGA